MESLQQFWTWTYVLGIGAFIAMSIVIVPFGFRDLLRLLRELGADEHADTAEADRSPPCGSKNPPA